MMKITTIQSPLRRLPKQPNKRMVILGVLVVIAPLAVYGISSVRSRNTPTSLIPIEAANFATPVTALGRIEPKNEVIHVSAPTDTAVSRIKTLLVEEGERVEAGQVVAILDSYEQRLAD